MRARYYDPVLGRFISEDPLGFGGGDVNLMVYTSNDPVNWVDPWGLKISDFPGDVVTAFSGAAQDVGPAFAGAANSLGITSGRVQAVAYTAAGMAITAAGFVTSPEGAPLIGLGVPLLAEGITRLGVESLGGDTGSIPFGLEILYDIGVGIGNAYGECSE